MGSRIGHSCFSLFYCPSAFTFKLICASSYCYTGSSTIPIFPFLQHSYVSLSTASLLLKVESPLTAGCSQLCPVRFCIPPKMEIPQLFSATAKRLTILTVKKRKKKKKWSFLYYNLCPLSLLSQGTTEKKLPWTLHPQPVKPFLFVSTKCRGVTPLAISLITCVRKLPLLHSIDLLDLWLSCALLCCPSSSYCGGWSSLVSNRACEHEASSCCLKKSSSTSSF